MNEEQFISDQFKKLKQFLNELEISFIGNKKQMLSYVAQIESILFLIRRYSMYQRKSIK